MKKLLFVLLLSVAVMGCDKKNDVRQDENFENKSAETVSDNNNAPDAASELQNAVEAYVKTSEQQINSGNFEEASKTIAKAASESEQKSEALTDAMYVSFGKQQSLARNFVEAEKMFTKAIAINNNNFVAYKTRGEIRSYTGSDINGAMQDFEKAININSGDVEVYILRGVVYAQLNNNEAAIADFSKAIQLDQNNFRAYMERAKAKNKAGDVNGAKEDINIANSKDNGDPFYSIELAKLQDSIGDVNGAIATITKSVSIVPLVQNLEVRVKLYEKTGQKELAKQDLQKIEELKAQR